MSTYSNLIGLQYDMGRVDCYSIIRNYFAQEYGLRLRNYARPDRFWEDGLDLYKLFKLEGAKAIGDENLQIGDVLLMPLLTPFATHACVVVENNTILHHLPGRLSSVDPLHKWYNRATAIVRHPTVTKINEERRAGQTVHLHEVLNAHVLRTPEFQATVERVLGRES